MTGPRAPRRAAAAPRTPPLPLSRPPPRGSRLLLLRLGSIRCKKQLSAGDNQRARAFEALAPHLGLQRLAQEGTPPGRRARKTTGHRTRRSEIHDLIGRSLSPPAPPLHSPTRCRLAHLHGLLAGGGLDVACHRGGSCPPLRFPLAGEAAQKAHGQGGASWVVFLLQASDSDERCRLLLRRREDSGSRVGAVRGYWAGQSTAPPFLALLILRGGNCRSAVQIQPASLVLQQVLRYLGGGAGPGD